MRGQTEGREGHRGMERGTETGDRGHDEGAPLHLALPIGPPVRSFTGTMVPATLGTGCGRLSLKNARLL